MDGGQNGGSFQQFGASGGVDNVGAAGNVTSNPVVSDVQNLAGGGANNSFPSNAQSFAQPQSIVSSGVVSVTPMRGDKKWRKGVVFSALAVAVIGVVSVTIIILMNARAKDYEGFRGAGVEFNEKYGYTMSLYRDYVGDAVNSSSKYVRFFPISAEDLAWIENNLSEARKAYSIFVEYGDRLYNANKTYQAALGLINNNIDSLSKNIDILRQFYDVFAAPVISGAGSCSNENSVLILTKNENPSVATAAESYYAISCEAAYVIARKEKASESFYARLRNAQKLMYASFLEVDSINTGQTELSELLRADGKTDEGGK